MRRIIWMLLAVCMASCDEGDIYPNGNEGVVEGREVVINGEVKGRERVPRGYTLVVAGFSGESEYTMIQKSVVEDRLEGFRLSGIPEEVDRVELCLVNSIRRRMVSLYTAELSGNGDANVEMGAVDVSGDGVMQRCVFDVSCVACHGGSNKEAAGLWLTEDKAIESIVGVESKRDSMGRMIVEEGNKEESFMWLILTGRDGVETLKYNHSNIIGDKGLMEYVGGWIEGR